MKGFFHTRLVFMAAGVSTLAFLILLFGCYMHPWECAGIRHRFSDSVGYFISGGKRFEIYSCHKCDAKDTFPNYQLYLRFK